MALSVGRSSRDDKPEPCRSIVPHQMNLIYIMTADNMEHKVVLMRTSYISEDRGVARQLCAQDSTISSGYSHGYFCAPSPHKGNTWGCCADRCLPLNYTTV